MTLTFVGRQVRSRSMSAVDRCTWLAALPVTVPRMRRAERIFSVEEKGCVKPQKILIVSMIPSELTCNFVSRPR